MSHSRLADTQKVESRGFIVGFTDRIIKKFDQGEDITSLLDLKKAKRSSQIQKRINADLPESPAFIQIETT